MEKYCWEKTAGPREYWMIYRGPSFLAVVWFRSSPTPLLPSQSSCVSSVELTDMRGEGRGWARSQIIRPWESLALYESCNTVPFWLGRRFKLPIMSCEGSEGAQLIWLRCAKPGRYRYIPSAEVSIISPGNYATAVKYNNNKKKNLNWPWHLEMTWGDIWKRVRGTQRGKLIMCWGVLELHYKR